MKTPDYLTYDRYKKKKDTNPKRRLSLFLWTFFFSLAAFLVLASVIAPDVDVTIGDDVEMEEKNIGLGVKQFVDSRLRTIDLDDLGKLSLYEQTGEEETASSEKDDYAEEEKIELPVTSLKKEKSASEQKSNEPAVMPAYEAPRPDKNEVILQTTQQSNVYKVYVGKYSNSTQAKVAKDILMDSGLDVSPFVKNVNGVYTLQIGSFAERSRAEQAAGELTRNGFPARISQE
ncbi:SPOR domain-containing protein [bacterium]|nr:SPOR domain-containing protein [bacterium]